jgi:putative ABC transport system permease protein
VGIIIAGGFVQDIYVQLGEALIHSQSGHIQVARANFFSSGSRSPERYQIQNSEGLGARIAALPEVKESMRRVSFSGMLNNGRTDLAIIGEGVEPDKENRLGTHLRIVAGRRLADTDALGIMLGQGVAKALALGPGDQATLLANTAGGALNTLDVEVVGVFQSFSKDFDARAVRLPLRAAQELLGTRGVNTVVLSLAKTADTALVANQLQPVLASSGLELKTWSELNDFYDKTIDLYEKQFGFLQFIILVMVVLSVANAVNAGVLERIGEFGTMKALGYRNRDVFRLVLVEGILIGVMGASVGVLLGIGLANVISFVGIAMPPPPNSELGYRAFVRVIPAVVSAAFAIGLVATVLASLQPARRVSKGDISEALRHRF